MHNVTCNYCGSSEQTAVNSGADLQLARPGNYRLVRCISCGLVYQTPKLDIAELANHYPDEYLSYPTDLQGERTLLEQADRRHAMRRRVQKIERFRPAQGRVLDIGCATGEFLDAMRESGWQCCGVELSQHAASYAREQLDLDVRTGLLEDIRFDDATFDVVTMWDVIEHVSDPKVTIAEIRRILKPGGLFVAMTPNPSSLEAKLFGSHWAGWDRPRHLHIFPPKVLRAYLQDAGFDQIDIISFSGRLSVTLLSFRYWLTSCGISLTKAERLTKILYNYPLRILSLPFYLLGERFNQTTGMTAFATLPFTARQQ